MESSVERCSSVKSFCWQSNGDRFPFTVKLAPVEDFWGQQHTKTPLNWVTTCCNIPSDVSLLSRWFAGFVFIEKKTTATELMPSSGLFNIIFRTFLASETSTVTVLIHFWFHSSAWFWSLASSVILVKRRDTLDGQWWTCCWPLIESCQNHLSYVIFSTCLSSRRDFH